MNQTTDLSPKQFEAMKAAFSKKHGISTLGLLREMKCDTAMAKNLIRQLLDIDFLADYKNGNHGVTREGRDYLIKMKVPGADRKPIGRPRDEDDYVDPYDMPPKKEPKILETHTAEDVPVTVLTVAELPAHDDSFLNMKAAKTNDLNRLRYETEKKREQLAKHLEPDQDDFMALVYRGLSKLNAQLGVQPATIENKAIKIEALNRFAETLSEFDQALSELLRSVALDLERLGGVK